MTTEMNHRVDCVERDDLDAHDIRAATGERITVVECRSCGVETLVREDSDR